MVKDILREIKRKWFQFIAITLITALGVGFFIGIQVTGFDMRLTGDLYAKNALIMDFAINTSLGIDDEMIEGFQSVFDGKVVGEVSGSAYLIGDDAELVVTAIGFSDNTRKDLTLIEGRLPQKEGEVVVDSPLPLFFDLSINDTLSIEGSDVLLNQEAVIVGFVNSSLYMNQERGSSKMGRIDGFIYSQGLAVEDDLYTGMRLILNEEADKELERENLEAHQDEFLKARLERIKAPLLLEIEEAQILLDDNILIAKEEFDSAWKQLVKGERQLRDTKNELELALDELNQSSLTGTLQERLKQSEANVSSMKQTLDEAFQLQLQAIEQMPEGPEKTGALQALEAEKTRQLALIKVMVQANEEISQGIISYETGRSDLAASRETYYAEKHDAEVKFEDAQKEIDRNLEKINDLDQGTIYIRNREDIIVGYEAFYQDSNRIESIGKVFPLIFFGVAILVTLSTITRMIEESRLEIGIYKALGFSWLQSSLKFAGFTFLAWFIGSSLGIIIGFYMIPHLIYNAYRIMYLTPNLEGGFELTYAYIPLILSFLASVGIAFVKATSVSRNTAASLMIPPAPKGGQRILLERFGFIWLKLSFLYKVSLRNLFRNKTRFLMTVVGIGGCCGLLITGFGIKHSINSIVDMQFNAIVNYDGIVVFEDGFENDETMFNNSTLVSVENVDVGRDEVSIYAGETLQGLSEMIQFKDRKTQTSIDFDENSVIISEKLASVNRIEVGDLMTFTLDDIRYSVIVDAITQNYVAHYIYVSQDRLESIIHQESPAKMVLFQYDGENIQELSDSLLKQDFVLRVSLLDELAKTYREMMGNFDIVIVVIVGAAFLLELIVLLNLISMNMSERHKELATLKVLGFYPKELSSYILRENIMLSFISLIVGVIFGKYLHHFVVVSAEIDMLMFNRELQLGAVVLACVLTFALSILINLVMSRKANDVNMAEALKS